MTRAVGATNIVTTRHAHTTPRSSTCISIVTEVLAVVLDALLRTAWARVQTNYAPRPVLECGFAEHAARRDAHAEHVTFQHRSVNHASAIAAERGCVLSRKYTSRGFFSWAVCVEYRVPAHPPTYRDPPNYAWSVMHILRPWHGMISTRVPPPSSRWTARTTA